MKICCYRLVINTCDQICQKESYTHTVSRHTFYCHLLATSMDQKHICLILLKLEQSAFIQASLSSLFDIHKSFCDLRMAPSSLGKQTADCESPHDWLMSLPMDLAVFSKDVAFACHFVAPRPPTLPPYRSASGIDYASKKTIYNMMGNSASYPVYSRQ